MKKSDKDIEDGLDELVAQQKIRIAQHGFTLQAVLPDKKQPSYVYTIGLSQNFGHPEIFLAGMKPNDAASLILEVVDRITSGERFDKPAFAPGIIPGYEIPFRPMQEESVIDHSSMGLELIGPFDGIQMFYPDPDGYAPWESECDDRYRSQLFFELEGEPPRRNIELEVARAMLPPRDASRGRLPQEQIDANRRRIIGELREQISETGFVPQVVGGGDGHPGFLYTIGLSETWNHPELFIVALNPEQAFDIVAELVERIAVGERFNEAAYVDDILTLPLSVRPLDQRDVDDNSGIAQDVLGRPISAMQVYWPDQAGLMPWEDGCAAESVEFQLAIFKPLGEEPMRKGPPPGVSLQ
ncbi:DUF4262 domain-containing protein [Agrobacterium rubi]|nr:DUF4262 domain-containing protein [Agrobacterium rubi]NTF24712.1 DUF4262 domain-containing protein [Agrobacterium rubi]